MTTFIFDVLKDLKNNHTNFSRITFILPSKRAGIFLKHQLASVINETIFSPSVISIEEFIEALSQLKSMSNTELLFEFYSSYSQIVNEKDKDTFESFSKWAQILLQDFNEIDRYLIPQEHIFNYLSAIEDLKHWSLEEPKTDFVKKYLAFWNKLYNYYEHFTKHLKDKHIGYQGLIYREATKKIDSYIKNNADKQHVFLGFNALNTSEETIIQKLLENNLANIYWDIDAVFMENKNHDAALFTRQHKNNWEFFKKNPFKWITEHYSEAKNIAIYGVPKNIGQAKYIGSLLSKLQKEKQTLQNTAVVLGDENLLIPVLNSLPEGIKALNVTMGFPLKSIPLASLFDALFHLHKNATNRFYYKDVIRIISHQFVRPLLHINHVDYASKLNNAIEGDNLVYLNIEELNLLVDKPNDIIELLFSNWNQSVEEALNNCLKLITQIKKVLDKDKTEHILSLEYLFRFNELFNELVLLNSRHEHIKDVSTLYSVYKELLSSETLDFQGEPLQGLQIMGMLESRVLDFETVIISSVNEGILPSGKSQNSFIPFDVKIENSLPAYKEKDAVYTYHFYRLLQRAKQVFIVYNTEADVLTGGEKSRFITQLELEGIHKINHQIITPQVPVIENRDNIVRKTPELIKALKEVAQNGLSPSSLTNYIRNPIDFYYQKILKIREYNEVEETVAANTLGTVVHNTLEDFYKPLIGEFLTVNHIEQLRPNIEGRVTYHFQKEYKKGDITRGKNLIVFEIAKRYVTNFLDLEIKALKEGNTIKIKAIEADNKVQVNIPELDFPVVLRGKVDRVDEYNGVIRIIDYKTGNVQQNQVEIVDWGAITTDYKKYSKSFQILSYAYMMQASNSLNFPIEAGIISFKNLSSGFLKFSKKESAFSRSKNTLIAPDTLLAFESELKKLILEICDPNIDFIEKDV
ncbi:PD-(D/E)XK nuclease family protein [Tamlana sp. 2201CG12-4]|uniref:PD-(D/E)XK nuclease family protein n=1 Tax=Tamlana sp. 2201CG12-4 TaxID=3112582 RepID=UPI002DB68C70|nr:PD-(D/E)XK nuclease family protein [Tamlana sp. 2201CG12-4]MEC3906021.1 PD-(D/E)XK nuclease family protein [Tamlana sp. 2201CG12-4]